jgi:hypothetical protein
MDEFTVLVHGFFFEVTNLTKCFVHCVFVARVLSFEIMKVLRVVNFVECAQEEVSHFPFLRQQHSIFTKFDSFL